MVDEIVDNEVREDPLMSDIMKEAKYDKKNVEAVKAVQERQNKDCCIFRTWDRIRHAKLQL